MLAWLVLAGLVLVRGRAAGPDLAILEAVIFAATAAEVRNVVIGGRDVVVDGRHLLIDDVPGALASAIRAVTAGG